MRPFNVDEIVSQLWTKQYPLEYDNFKLVLLQCYILFDFNVKI